MALAIMAVEVGPALAAIDLNGTDLPYSVERGAGRQTPSYKMDVETARVILEARISVEDSGSEG